ncbi:exo-beta-N-acetylmuramidase NamZ family protein [Poriferisphaera sp. WC338]|uniref:exo-beta-N-acetylmuramidase NamZ family protein n=1 Tax=Poriferisphaera sp. WC338 TaxID=3425129 RepID=UPI003D81A077
MNATKHEVLFGVDVLLADVPEKLKKARVGLLTNDAATTAARPHPYAVSRLAIHDSEINLVALFSPEHGIGAAEADGATVGSATDGLTGLPIHSLYGKHFAPTDTMLKEIDVLMIDVPDIGARFYTYIWTMSHILEKCAKAKKSIYVLDRPNPIGCDLRLAEGPILDETTFNSLVGRWDIPVRHSLTMGELANYWNEQKKIEADLNVVAMRHYNRSMDWQDTGLSFVPTSPAMNSAEEGLIYPGTTLFEGMNISEARGTSFPFRAIGAPWIREHELADKFNSLELPGVYARPATYIPADSWYKGETCRGVMLHVADKSTFRPVATGLWLSYLIWRDYDGDVAWATYPTANNYTGADHFDRLIGREDIRKVIEGRPSEAEMRKHVVKWTEIGNWTDRVSGCLLYNLA